MKKDSKSKEKVEEQVEKLAQPIVAANDLELVGVEYKKEGGHWYLRIFIDRDGGVNLEDCQMVSEQIGAKLDEVDPIAGTYILEVSSPGLERPLKRDRDYERFQGHQITVNTYAPYNGIKTFTGTLIGLREGMIVLEQNGEEIKIPRGQAARVHLVAQFD
ncbi:MAG: ribosome maturation factor RimP [Firmicutes bacterium]|nr:ribosome maturation factor RimP [Bacillota bacterium]